MQTAEAEDILFSRMSAPRDASVSHRTSLAVLSMDAVPLADHASIGVDTNVLKILRRDVGAAEQVLLTLKQYEVGLIVPGQCVAEFWNNHQIFATADWGSYKGSLAKLGAQIEANNVGGQFERELAEISRLVELIATDLQETKSPQYLALSRTLMTSIAESAQIPMVSRIRFAELARIRNASKNPPGFADEKLKGTTAYGDFFVWCDFLLGALMVENADRDHFAWVTEDSKPDWKTGAGGHPSLVEEFAWVTGRNLSILAYGDLTRLISDTDTEDEPEPSGGEQ